MESRDGRCECEATEDIVEIAESMDEVRGMGRTSKGKVLLGGGGEAKERGDGGFDLFKGVASGNGDETLRNWLYDWALNGDVVVFRKDPPSRSLVFPSTDISLVSGGSSTFSRDDLGGSTLVANLERGERGEYRKSPVALEVGDFGLLELLPGLPPAAADVVLLTCSGGSLRRLLSGPSASEPCQFCWRSG